MKIGADKLRKKTTFKSVITETFKVIKPILEVPLRENDQNDNKIQVEADKNDENYATDGQLELFLDQATRPQETQQKNK